MRWTRSVLAMMLCAFLAGLWSGCGDGSDSGPGGPETDVLDASTGVADGSEGDTGHHMGVDSATAEDSAVAADTTTGGDTGAADTDLFVCDLGTVYPDRQVIDPDAPVYEDASHTQAQVTLMFEQAKAANSDAYLAYRAARDYPQLMTCPFCPCGCDRSAGHLSAVDCFKDLHGFT